MFCPEDYDEGLLGAGTNPFFFFTTEEVTENIAMSVENYETWWKQSLDGMLYYYVPDDHRGKPEHVYLDNLPRPFPVRVDTWRLKSIDNRFDLFSKNALMESNDALIHESFNISSADLGPFDPENDPVDLSDYFVGIHQMQFEFLMQLADVRNSHAYYFTVIANYDFTVRGGRIALTIDSHAETIDEIVVINDVRKWYISVQALLIGASLFSQILSIKALAVGVEIYKRMRRKYAHRFDWDALPLSKKARFINPWYFLSIAAGSANIVGAIGTLGELYGESKVRGITRTIVAIGGLLSWTNLVRYLEWQRKYYILILALANAMPIISQFLLGVAPIMLGYALAGMAMFSSHTPLFANLDSSFATLFAVLNGDVMLDTFTEVYGAGVITSRLYFYSFVFIFMYAVLNIFIAIVERAFRSAMAFEWQKNKTKARAQERARKRKKKTAGSGSGSSSGGDDGEGPTVNGQDGSVDIDLLFQERLWMQLLDEQRLVENPDGTFTDTTAPLLGRPAESMSYPGRYIMGQNGEPVLVPTATGEEGGGAVMDEEMLKSHVHEQMVGEFGQIAREMQEKFVRDMEDRVQGLIRSSMERYGMRVDPAKVSSPTGSSPMTPSRRGSFEMSRPNTPGAPALPLSNVPPLTPTSDLSLATKPAAAQPGSNYSSSAPSGSSSSNSRPPSRPTSPPSGPPGQ